MSILSQLIEGKITFSQAVSQAEQWFSTILSKAPPAVQAGVGTGLSDFKQAASNAIAIGDTALGPIVSTATVAANTAANAALMAATGGAATPLIPLVDAGLDSIINAMHAEIDAVAAQFRAKLAAGPGQSAPVMAGGGAGGPATQPIMVNNPPSGGGV